MVSSSRKKSSNKRILFQVDITSVYTSKNGEFASEEVSTRRKSCLHRQKHLTNKRKLLRIAVIRFLNFLYDSNNGFH